MRIGKAFFENGAEAKPADAEVKTEKVIDKTAAEGTQSGGEGNGNADAGAAEGEGEGSDGGEDDTNPAEQDSTNEGDGGTDAGAAEEAPKKGKVGRPAKK